MTQFMIPSQLHFGDDAMLFFDSIEKHKIFILTDPFLAANHRTDRLIDRIKEKNTWFVSTDVMADPPIETIESAKKYFVETNATMLVAFGGGSAIDTAKGIIHLLSRENRDRPMFIAVPTTAGTGSEVTNFSVVTVGDTKEVWIDKSLFPDHAVLLAEFTLTVPPRITADTGIDVLTHAVEAYLSRNATPFTDVYAIQAIRSVFSELSVAYRDGSRKRNREILLNASCMAGIAFTNAGLGINHSLAHTIGGKFHIAHGRLNGILLPYVIRFHSERSPAVEERLKALSIQLGLSENESFEQALIKLLQSLDFESSLSELGIEAHMYYDALASMTEDALADRCTSTNPVLVTRTLLANVLRDAYEN